MVWRGVEQSPHWTPALRCLGVEWRSGHLVYKCQIGALAKRLQGKHGCGSRMPLLWGWERGQQEAKAGGVYQLSG